MFKNIRIWHCYAIFILMFSSFNAFCQTSWTGKASSDWSTPANWSSGAVPGPTDNIQIGITAFSFQPTINGNVSVNNLTFGGPLQVILTVNSGYTLTVSGKLVQNHTADNSVPSTILAGSGTLSALSIMVGDLTLSKLIQSKTTTLISQIANLNVTGSITINSTTANLLTGGVANNNSLFSLQGGVLNLGSQIITTNQIPVSCNLSGNYPNSKFSIDINSNNNATLILADSNAVSLSNINNAEYASIDFFNPISGSGQSFVKYAGGNQLVYTNTTPGVDTNPGIYQNLTIAGTGTKTAGTNTSNNLTIGGNLNITGGLFDLVTYEPQTMINGNFTNTAAINLGTSITTLTGSTFFNSGNFTVGTGLFVFAGSTQTLIDSTLNGTNFNKVSFNNNGIKNIQSGAFAVIPNGKLMVTNDATLNVVAGATLTIRADSTGSASIASLPANCTVTGQVNVQQYIQGSEYLNNTSARGYRFLSSPINFTGTLSGDRYFNINFIRGTNNYNGIMTSGASGGGFDITGNPSMYLFREDVSICNGSFTCGNFKGIAQINYADPNQIGIEKRFTTSYIADTTLTLPIGTSIYLFSRGNKVLSNGTTSGTKTTQPFNYPEDITLTHTGFINQGSISFKDWFRSDHILSYTNSTGITNGPGDIGVNLLGNPYPSAINWDNFSATDSTSSIYGPNLLPTIVVYNDATSQYNTYQADSTHDKTKVYYGTGIASNIVTTGNGFMVHVDPASANPYAASLTFREGAKYDSDTTVTNPQGSGPVPALLIQRNMAVKTATVTVTPNVLTTSRLSVANAKTSNLISSTNRKTKTPNKTVIPPDELIRIMLIQDNIENDDILIRFKQGAHSTFNPKEDAYDFGGSEEATVMLSSYSSDNVPLGINTLSLPVHSEKIALFTDATKSGTYTLKATAIQNIPLNYELRLKDKFNGSLINLRQINQYAFTIDKNNKATYGNRFELVITKK